MSPIFDCYFDEESMTIISKPPKIIILLKNGAHAVSSLSRFEVSKLCSLGMI